MGDRQQIAAMAQSQMGQMGQQELPPNIQRMNGGFGLSPEYIAQLAALSRPAPTAQGYGGGVHPDIQRLQMQLRALQLQQQQVPQPYMARR